MEEKTSWKTFKIRETKEVSTEHDVQSIKDSLEHLKNEVKRLEDLLKLAKTAGIDPDNMVEPQPIMPEPQPELVQPEVIV